MSRRRIDAKEIHLEVDDVRFHENEIIFSWISDIGFGEYAVFVDKDGHLKAYSECMDRNENKEFLQEVLAKASEHILKNVEIVE